MEEKSMNDEELLEWYKKNNGAKPAEMSEKDYELNMNRALKLQQDQQLQKNLATQQANVAKAQSNAQQSASISNEKLMKYLGQYQLSNGVAKGQASSDFINANNSYVANRANIANNAAAQQNDILESYRANKLSNDQRAYENEISILDKYRQREIEDQNRQYAEEERQRDIQKWELEMEAYKESLRQTIEDFNSTQQEKQLARQEADDVQWLEAANERINKVYLELLDDEGNLTEDGRDKILSEIEQYRNKFNNQKYYELLLDLYRTMVYNKALD